MIYLKGQIFVITCGEYDHYQIACLMRAQQNFDLKDQVIAFREAAVIEDDYEGDDSREIEEEFSAFLKSRGLAEIIEHEEVHLSSYGKISKELYCLHQKRSFHLFSGLNPDHGQFGTMAETCDDCRAQFLEETMRPATLEEYFAVYPHMRNPATGLRCTDEEYRSLHPAPRPKTLSPVR